MKQRLTISTPEECCILANALQCHCQKQVEEYQQYIRHLQREGRTDEATRILRYSEQVRQAHIVLGDRLGRIMRRFDDAIAPKGMEGSDTNTCPGDVAARDSY